MRSIIITNLGRLAAGLMGLACMAGFFFTIGQIFGHEGVTLIQFRTVYIWIAAGTCGLQTLCCCCELLWRLRLRRRPARTLPRSF
jgi:hypothetical protein